MVIGTVVREEERGVGAGSREGCEVVQDQSVRVVHAKGRQPYQTRDSADDAQHVQPVKILGHAENLNCAWSLGILLV